MVRSTDTEGKSTEQFFHFEDLVALMETDGSKAI
jgi:hypothetical protein